MWSETPSAGLVGDAADWDWSSAAVHAGRARAPDWLAMGQWRETFTAEEWRTYLALDTLTEADLALRANTHSGRPIGSKAFVETAETALGRHLHARKGGRPPGRQLAAGDSREAVQGNLLLDV